MLHTTINNKRVPLPQTEAVLLRVAKLWKRRAQYRLRQEDRNATGTLTRSMKPRLGVQGGSPFVDITPAQPYWRFVDSGVRGAVENPWPGQGSNEDGRPYQFRQKRPPVDAIMAWLKVRGITARDAKGRFKKGGQRGLAFGIAERIRQRGLKPSWFITATGSAIEKKYAEEIAAAYMADIAETITETP